MKSESELLREWQVEQRRRRVKSARKHRRKVAFWEMLAPRSTVENLTRRRWLARNRDKVMAEFRRRDEQKRLEDNVARRNERALRYRKIAIRRFGSEVSGQGGGCYAHSG